MCIVPNQYKMYIFISNTDQTLDIRVEVATYNEDQSELKRDIETNIFETFKYLEVCNESDSAYGIYMKLSDHGRRIKCVTQGSIIFTISCPTPDACDDLCQLCITGILAGMFESVFITDDYSQGVTLTVTVDVTNRQQQPHIGELLFESGA